MNPVKNRSHHKLLKRFWAKACVLSHPNLILEINLICSGNNGFCLSISGVIVETVWDGRHPSSSGVRLVSYEQDRMVDITIVQTLLSLLI
jgi:hypothetical protein